jgi:hypothetical protein
MTNRSGQSRQSGVRASNRRIKVSNSNGILSNPRSSGTMVRKDPTVIPKMASVESERRKRTSVSNNNGSDRSGSNGGSRKNNDSNVSDSSDSDDDLSNNVYDGRTSYQTQNGRGVNLDDDLRQQGVGERLSSRGTIELLTTQVNDLKAELHSTESSLVDLAEKFNYKVEEVEELQNELRVAETDRRNYHSNTGMIVDEVIYDQVCIYVRKTLFKKVKFTIDSALDSVLPGTVGYVLCNTFNIENDKKIAWWNLYKQAAHVGITQSRNGKITELKKSFRGKIQYTCFTL